MIENKETYFELKDSGDFIKIKLVSFAYPDADLDWDRNWINSKVTIKAGGFSGQFDCNFMTTDFERFRIEFAQLYTKLSGTASFDTIEGQVSIKIKGDGIGHFEADCLAMDYAGTGNTLEFEMVFDQTIIPEIVRQLDNITKTFPILGDMKIKNE
jgi:hypothetical protein